MAGTRTNPPQLIAYTESTFKENKIDILTKTMVKEVKPNAVIVQRPDKTIEEIPCGLLVWAGVRIDYHNMAENELMCVAGQQGATDYKRLDEDIGRCSSRQTRAASRRASASQGSRKLHLGSRRLHTNNICANRPGRLHENG
jgi:hypothetical protein